MRHWLPSILNESVCMLPWPDHVPRGRHPTTACRAGLGSDAHAPTSRAATSKASFIYGVSRVPCFANAPEHVKRAKNRRAKLNAISPRSVSRISSTANYVDSRFAIAYTRRLCPPNQAVAGGFVSVARNRIVSQIHSDQGGNAREAVSDECSKGIWSVGLTNSALALMGDDIPDKQAPTGTS